ncbi:MAG TPA: ABC transporter permease [Stellaceae bacterium]|nr:ABC transporter permease [Stellaceae bacterium]
MRGRAQRRPPGVGGRAALRAVVAAIYVFLFLPIVAVVLLSFSENISVIDFGHFTLRWYEHLVRNAPVLAALRFSIVLGILASAMAVLLGSLAAFGLVRGRMRGKAALQAALYAPIVVPEIIISVALLILFVLLRIPRGTLALVIGHSVLILPYVFSIVSARLYGFDRSLEDAAANLGATPMQTLREITLPLMLPAIVGAALIAFKVSFDEVVGSMFWSTAREQPMPVLVFSMLQFELTPEVNAIGTVMLAVTFSVLGVYQLIEWRRRAELTGRSAEGEKRLG